MPQAVEFPPVRQNMNDVRVAGGDCNTLGALPRIGPNNLVRDPNPASGPRTGGAPKLVYRDMATFSGPKTQ